MAQGAILAGLLAGLGYTVMPSAVVREEVEAGRLRVIARRGRPVLIDFYARRRPGPHSPALEAFFGYLRGVAEHPAEPASLVGAH